MSTALQKLIEKVKNNRTFNSIRVDYLALDEVEFDTRDTEQQMFGPTDV